MSSLIPFIHLLDGAIRDRPYVFVFFLVYLAFAFRSLGLGGTILYTLGAYLIAFGCEYSSTRNGFPFGFYLYHDSARVRELWISNIPFWDPLSFVFLSYFSWRVAESIWTRSLKIIPGTGLLMMLLDVVIDPVALQGNRWFLGKIYEYPQGGVYFGVTLANFAGWFLVGVMIATMIRFFIQARWVVVRMKGKDWGLEPWGCLAVYAGVFAFNLFVTGMIRSWNLFMASGAVVLLTLSALGALVVKESNTRSAERRVSL